MMFPGVGPSGSGLPCSPVGAQPIMSPSHVSGDSPQSQYSYMVNTLSLVPSSAALYGPDRGGIQHGYPTQHAPRDGVDMSRAAFLPYGLPAIDGSILPDTTTNLKSKKPPAKTKGVFGMMKMTPLDPGGEVGVYSTADRKTKKCDICSDVLTESEGSATPVPGGRKAMCDVCRKFLVRMQALEQMKEETAGQHKLQCQTCQKGYASLATLKMHMRVHIGTKCYKCTFCERNFLYEGNLRTHVRVHTGEKPYTCDQCGKCFSQSGTLKKHMRMHTGEKPYKCDICEKSFAYSENLIPHKRVHSQERPFSCHLCDKSYTQPGSLKSHLKVVHNSVSTVGDEEGIVGNSQDDHVPPCDGHVLPAVDRQDDEVVTSLQHIVG